MSGDNFAAKHRDGTYWCGNSLGWVACRFCARKMPRGEAHARAHAAHGRVVRIVKPTSHALANLPPAKQER